jgi:hypothetical protein
MPPSRASIIGSPSIRAGIGFFGIVARLAVETASRIAIAA